MGKMLGYCTNVHAGANLAEMRSNLATHAVAVRRLFSPDEPMGIGLWFSAKSAEQLVNDKQVDEFRQWLDEYQLVPFTLNGFPYGDFHQKQVKHAVYLPTWESQERLAYTLLLTDILDQLLPAGRKGSISTLPIAWEMKSANQAADNLVAVACQLHRLRENKGRHIQVCIEPEPGCAFQYSSDVVRFFNQDIDAAVERARAGESFAVRDYLTVCHDTCHASVMFEPQADAIAAYRDAGISIGKVQISAAIEIPFVEMDSNSRQQSVEQLDGFAEDRYLHQTVCRDEDTGATRFFEDLPLALADARTEGLNDRETWRVHFHVPLFLREFGQLRSTQDETRECCNLLAGDGSVTDFEVETYAWGVLPKPLQAGNLAEGISREMDWARKLILV